MAKTSLEKSHSKSSNFKLTMICLLASLGVASLFVGLGFLKQYQTLAIILLAAGGVLTLLGLLLINKFTR